MVTICFQEDHPYVDLNMSKNNESITDFNSANPASRLLDFLDRALALKNSEGTKDALMHLLGTTNTVELYKRIADAYELVALTRKATKFYFPNYQALGHWEKNVSTSFEYIHFRDQWVNFKSNIDTHTRHYLYMTAQMLEAVIPKSSATQDQIEKFRADLTAILNEAIASKEPEALKIFLANSINRIINALDNYRITADVAVLQAINSVYGEVITNKQIQKDGKSSSLIKKMFGAIGASISVFTTAKEVSEAIEHFQKYIE